MYHSMWLNEKKNMKLRSDNWDKTKDDDDVIRKGLPSWYKHWRLHSLKVSQTLPLFNLVNCTS